MLPRLNMARNEIGYIPKGQENTFHKYQFRGIDDVLNVVGPALLRQGVLAIPEYKDHHFDVINFTKKNGSSVSMVMSRIRLDLHFIAEEDGSRVTATAFGEGRDESDDKATAKAQTAAYKTAVFFGLMLPVAPDIIDDSDRNQPTDEGVAAARASSALNRKDTGENRTNRFNKAREIIAKTGEACDMKRLGELSKHVESDAAFSAEERAALVRLINSYVNKVHDAKKAADKPAAS